MFATPSTSDSNASRLHSCARSSSDLDDALSEPADGNINAIVRDLNDVLEEYIKLFGDVKLDDLPSLKYIGMNIIPGFIGGLIGEKLKDQNFDIFASDEAK